MYQKYFDPKTGLEKKPSYDGAPVKAEKPIFDLEKESGVKAKTPTPKPSPTPTPRPRASDQLVERIVKAVADLITKPEGSSQEQMAHEDSEKKNITIKGAPLDPNQKLQQAASHDGASYDGFSNNAPAAPPTLPARKTPAPYVPKTVAGTGPGPRQDLPQGPSAPPQPTLPGGSVPPSGPRPRTKPGSPMPHRGAPGPIAGMPNQGRGGSIGEAMPRPRMRTPAPRPLGPGQFPIPGTQGDPDQVQFDGIRMRAGRKAPKPRPTPKPTPTPGGTGSFGGRSGLDADGNEIKQKPKR